MRRHLSRFFSGKRLMRDLNRPQAVSRLSAIACDRFNDDLVALQTTALSVGFFR